MDDDGPSPASDHLAALGREDLTILSISDLEERIAALEAEILRCREIMSSKNSSRAAADGLFKP